MTDQRMPSVTGVELLARVKARKPQAIRMLFTGFADLESIVAAINQGHVFQFLKKPWRPEELQEAVRLAAIEYDRLVVDAEENDRLRDEIRRACSERVAALESRRQGRWVESSLALASAPRPSPRRLTLTGPQETLHDGSAPPYPTDRGR